jgi:hypothetical protein
MAHCAPLRWGWGCDVWRRCDFPLAFQGRRSRTQTGRSGFGGIIVIASVALKSLSGEGTTAPIWSSRLGERAVTPCLARNQSGRRSNGRTTRHPRLRDFPAHPQTYRGSLRLGQDRGGPAEDTAPRPAQGRLVIPLAMAVYDLVRPPKLLAQAASPPVRLPNNIMINPRDDSFRWVIGISDSPPSPRRTSKVGLQR